MSCQCNLEKKFGEGIKLEEKEVNRFYELKSKEDALQFSLSNDVISKANELDESRFIIYIKSLNEEYAKALYESNLFLMSLRKKYNCKDFMIDNDLLCPILEK